MVAISRFLLGGAPSMSTGSRFLDIERAEKERQRREEDMQNQQQTRQYESLWERMRGRLSQNQDSFDAAGRAQVGELNKKAEALRKSRDKLRPAEYVAELQKLQKEAMDFPWEHHEKKPDQNIIVQDGVQLQKTDRGMEAINYTPDYIQKNTVQLPNGHMAIPLGPGKGYKILEKAPDAGRDLEFESQTLDTTSSGIDKIYKELEKKALKNSEGDELSPEKQVELYKQAGDQYIARNLQAKHVAKVIADGGGAEEAIPGRTFDPFKAKDNIQRMEQKKKELQKEVKKVDRFIKKKTADQQWEPFEISVTPDVGQEFTPEQQAEIDRLSSKKAAAGGNMPERMSAVPAEFSLAQKMEMANQYKSVTRAYSPNEFNTLFAQAADGTVVETPDQQRWVKHEGKFVPVQQQELAIENPYVGGITDKRLLPGANPYYEEGKTPPRQKRPLEDMVKQATKKENVPPEQMSPEAWRNRTDSTKLPALASDVSGENAWRPGYRPEAVEGIKALQQEAMDAYAKRDLATVSLNQEAIRWIQRNEELYGGGVPSGRALGKPTGIEFGQYTAEGLKPVDQLSQIKAPISQEEEEVDVPQSQPMQPTAEPRPLTSREQVATRLRAQYPDLSVRDPQSEWHKDPQLKADVLNAPSVKNLTEVMNLPEGKPFKLPNGETVIRINDKMETLDQVPAIAKTEQYKQWTTNADLTKKAKQAKALSPAANPMELQEGTFFWQNKNLYAIVNGRPVQVPSGSLQPPRIKKIETLQKRFPFAGA